MPSGSSHSRHRLDQMEFVQQTGSDVFFASVEGDLDSLSAALSAGGSPDWENEEGQRPLHASCRHGHCECVDLLISVGANINAIAATGWTPLINASYWGHVDCVRSLLSHGAELHHLGGGHGYDQFTASDYANHVGHGACLALLRSAERRVKGRPRNSGPL